MSDVLSLPAMDAHLAALAEMYNKERYEMSVNVRASPHPLYEALMALRCTSSVEPPWPGEHHVENYAKTVTPPAKGSEGAKLIEIIKASVRKWTRLALRASTKHDPDETDHGADVCRYVAHLITDVMCGMPWQLEHCAYIMAHLLKAIKERVVYVPTLEAVRLCRSAAAERDAEGDRRRRRLDDDGNAACDEAEMASSTMSWPNDCFRLVHSPPTRPEDLVTPMMMASSALRARLRKQHPMLRELPTQRTMREMRERWYNRFADGHVAADMLVADSNICDFGQDMFGEGRYGCNPYTGFTIDNTIGMVGAYILGVLGMPLDEVKEFMVKYAQWDFTGDYNHGPPADVMASIAAAAVAAAAPATAEP